MDPLSQEVLWIVVVSFILALLLAFGVGANDVANSFGTSVGSKVLTLRQACIIATIFEVLGAITLGYKVSDTVRKGILDVNIYNNSEKELMLGNMAALGGSAVWNIAATLLKMPISGTHSVIGAVIGFTLVARGTKGVQWITVGKIVGSWFLSPLLSGIISVTFFMIIKYLILNKEQPLNSGLRMMPIFYGFTIFINIFSIVHDGPEFLKFNIIPWWGVLILSLGIGLIVGLLVYLLVVPYIRRKILSENDKNQPNTEMNVIKNNVDLKDTDSGIVLKKVQKLQNEEINGFERNQCSDNHQNNANGDGGSNQTPNDANKKVIEQSGDDKPEVSAIFSSLQILTATFGSFVHGGNDVSNCVGPLIAIWLIYQDGSATGKSQTPIYLLVYGGIGISIGLWIWGRRVIETMGTNLTKITPSSGFTIEIGAAFTVLLASKIGLPISTTHCKVGSVVIVGRVRSNEGVDWSLFRNIVLAWLVTLPITGGITAALMAILRATVPL